MNIFIIFLSALGLGGRLQDCHDVTDFAAEINFPQIALHNTLMLIQVICNMQDMLESVYMIIIIYSITCLDEINE